MKMPIIDVGYPDARKGPNTVVDGNAMTVTPNHCRKRTPSGRFMRAAAARPAVWNGWLIVVAPIPSKEERGQQVDSFSIRRIALLADRNLKERWVRSR